MNVYTNSYNGRLVPQRPKLSYKQILDRQIQQKKNKLRQIYTTRHQTQPICPVELLSPRYQSIDIYNKTPSRPRKLYQQSTYLPILNKSQKFQRQKAAFMHNRVYSMGDYNPLYPNQTQNQTVLALAQCQLIIQNLKKLTMSSRGVKRKVNIYDQFNVPSYVPYNNDYRQKNEKLSKQKQSLAQKQVMMFRAYQPSRKSSNMSNNRINQKPDKYNRYNKLKSNKYSGSNQSQYSNSNSNSQLKSNQKSIQIGMNNSKNIEQQQDEDNKSKISGEQQKDQFQNSSQYIKNLTGDKNDQSINSEETRAAQQYERKRINKQKRWLKYLAKARIRGVQLQEKILQFKQRLQQKTDISDKEQRYNQKADNYKSSSNASKLQNNRDSSSSISPTKMKILSRKLDERGKVK